MNEKPEDVKCLCGHPRYLHERRATPYQYEYCRAKGCGCTHYMAPESQPQQDGPRDRCKECEYPMDDGDGPCEVCYFKWKWTRAEAALVQVRDALNGDASLGIEISNLRAIAWHLRAGHDNGKVPREGLAEFLEKLHAKLFTARAALAATQPEKDHRATHYFCQNEDTGETYCGRCGNDESWCERNPCEATQEIPK